MATKLAVTGQSVSKNGRVITLRFTRAPEPNESMDAREWADISREFRAEAQRQIERHGRSVEIYGAAPECQDWMIDQILP